MIFIVCPFQHVFANRAFIIHLLTEEVSK
jgi:hypothetical protein